MPNYVKFKRGSMDAYNSLLQKDIDTLYFIYDENELTGQLYLGSKLITGSGEVNGATSLSDLSDVVLAELQTNDFLVYDLTQSKWVNKPVTEVLKAFVGATANSSGKVGLVPAPEAGQHNLFLRGDGTWSEVVTSSEAQVFQTIIGIGETHAQAISRVINESDATPKVGDIVILQNLIVENNYQRISYIFNGEKWAAMDGNYSADTVYFSDDLLTTSPIGNIELVNGQATIPAKGKNLKELFNTIFVKEVFPEATDPVVIVKLTEAGAYEVGSEVTVNYIASLSTGSYTYGPETGINATSWAIEDSNGATATAELGNFEKVTVEDDFNYFITATATHNAGAIPVTNTGNDYADAQIAAGTKIGTSNAITGYRNSFYGTMESKPEELLSDDIRNLVGKSKKNLFNGSSFSINVPVGALRVLIAYPATLRDLTSVLDKNDSNSNIVSGFGTPNIVQVAGANNHDAIDYKVYKMDFANPYDAANVFTVTI